MKLRYPLRLPAAQPAPSAAAVSRAALVQAGRVLVEPEARIIEIPSRSDAGKKWPVRMTPAGPVCPCPGFTYRRTCDHVGKARLQLMEERNARNRAAV